MNSLHTSLWNSRVTQARKIVAFLRQGVSGYVVKQKVGRFLLVLFGGQGGGVMSSKRVLYH